MSRPGTFNQNRMDALRKRFLSHPLALALTATILFRLYGLYIVKVLNNDVIFYADLTRRLSAGGILQGIREIAGLAYSPLYPLMIHGLDAVFQDTLRAAVAVSFIFGTLCVIPFFVIARHVFDDRKAMIASLLFAGNSYFVRYSIYVIRDMTALFFFLSSAALLVSRRPAKAYRWIGFAVCAFLAISTRPEYLLIYALGWTGFLIITRRWKPLFLMGVSVSAFVLALALSKAHPEIALLRLVLWERVALGLGAIGNHVQQICFPGSFWSAAAVSSRSFVELVALLTPIAGIISLIGAGHAAWRRREISSAKQILLTTILFGTILYTVWGSVGGYFTRRFLILPGCLLLMFVGDGVEAIQGWARRRPKQLMNVILILLFSSVALHTLFHEVGGRREGLKLAGLHIFRTWQGKTTPVILSDEQIIAFYARGIHASIQEAADPKDLESLLRDRKIDYMILKVIRSQGPGKAVENLVERGSIALDATLPYGERDGKGREIRVYRTRSDPS